MINKKAAGEKLKQIRLQRNLSVPQMAEFLGIDVGTYRKYEAGQSNPLFTRAYQIAERLEISFSQLWEREAEDEADAAD